MLILPLLFFTAIGGIIGMACGLLKHAKLLESNRSASRHK
jgi:hypothetical protein